MVTRREQKNALVNLFQMICSDTKGRTEKCKTNDLPTTFLSFFEIPSVIEHVSENCMQFHVIDMFTQKQ